MRTREEDRAYYWANHERRRADSRRWYARHREREAARRKAAREADPAAWRKMCRERNKKYRAANPGNAKSQHHGLTTNEVNAKAAAQGGCAICRTNSPGGRGWNGDHDHGTGFFRAVLCHHCNVGLGHFKDKPDLLRVAAAYLEKHAQLHALL